MVDDKPRGLNGRTRISLHWVGAFVVGFVTCFGVLYEIRRMEIEEIERSAQQRAILAATVQGNQAILRKVETRQEWVIRVVELMAQKMGIKKDELPQEPQPPAEGWQKKQEQRLDLDNLLRAIDASGFREAGERRR